MFCEIYLQSGAHITKIHDIFIANEQAERRRSACEAASLMPREVLQQAGKFSIVL